MAFLLAQGGSTLYKVDVSTGTATALTLPTGVTLSTTRKPKFAMLNQWVVMVNSPTNNLLIDPEGIVTTLVPQAPVHPPTLAANTSFTGRTGAYVAAVTFIVKNSDGDLLVESPFSPLSASVTLTDDGLTFSDVAISPDAQTTGRRVYVSLAGGDSLADLFHLCDIDDNTTTTFLDTSTDAQITLLTAAVTSLASPPGTLKGIRLKNVVQWKSRVWGVADDPSLVDSVYATETNKVYAWPNVLVAYPTGQSVNGVVAFAPRKNQLGLLKNNGAWAATAATSSTGVAFSNISVGQIDQSDDKGCIAEESVVVIGDAAYWLGRNAVYEWTDQGIKDITSDSVKPWFNSDTYFNRSRFANAFGRYNKVTNSYELHVAGVGDSTETRWVSFNLNNRKWYGPHKTGALTPSCAASLADANGLPMTVVGGTDGVIYTGNNANKRDGAATAIDMDCFGPWHVGDNPDLMHTWLQLSVLSRIESAGTLDVIPYVGGLDASAGTTMTHTLTTGRELLSRLGVGRLSRLRFRKNTVNQSATIYGYELPWITNGRR